MRVSLCLRKKAYRKPNREPESAPDARTLLTQPGLTVARCVPGPPAGPDILQDMPARLRFPACPELGDQIGLRRTKGFLSPEPPRAQDGAKRTPLAADKPPRDSWSGRYGEPDGRNRSRWLMFPQRALSKTLQDP